MKIHGLRIYPQSVELVPGDGTPIYVHGRVSENCSDFFYTFRPLSSAWRDHFIANEFTVTYSAQGRKDPLPGLREQFGPSLVAANIDARLLMLRGDDFERWGASMRFCEGAFLPIFRERPSFSLLKQLYWHFQLTSESWPTQMRSVLHMWDDIYWQLFSTEKSDIDTLIRAHAGDPKLKLYHVDLDREFPDPSNLELQPALSP